MTDSNGFVADGYERARSANEPAVRQETESKYAAQIANASWLQQRKLRKQIEIEIEQQLDELAPPDALY